MNTTKGPDVPAAATARIRVVVADDSVLLREGVARILEEGGLEVIARCGTAGDLTLKVRFYEPDLAIVTSGCRRPTPTRDCAPPRRSESATPTPRYSSSLNTSSQATRWRCLLTAPRGSVTC